MAVIANIQRVSAVISMIIPNAVMNMRIMLRSSPISFSMWRQLLRRSSDTTGTYQQSLLRSERKKTSYRPNCTANPILRNVMLFLNQLWSIPSSYPSVLDNRASGLANQSAVSISARKTPDTFLVIRNSYPMPNDNPQYPL